MKLSKLSTTEDTGDRRSKTYKILPRCPARPLWWSV